jgi:hypothetical protein
MKEGQPPKPMTEGLERGLAADDDKEVDPAYCMTPKQIAWTVLFLLVVAILVGLIVNAT